MFKGAKSLPANPIPVPIIADAREKEALLLPSNDEDSYYNIPLSVISK